MKFSISLITLCIGLVAAAPLAQESNALGATPRDNTEAGLPGLPGLPGSNQGGNFNEPPVPNQGGDFGEPPVPNQGGNLNEPKPNPTAPPKGKETSTGSDGGPIVFPNDDDEC